MEISEWRRDSGIKITTGDQRKPVGIKKKKNSEEIFKYWEKKTTKKKNDGKGIKWNKNTNLGNLELQWHYIDVYD